LHVAEVTETRTAVGGLKERTRDAVRQEIAEAALLLFDEQGFDETTVEQIASAAGLSCRSFFRYFPRRRMPSFGTR
jgi:AcrR family transcriptional regulator